MPASRDVTAALRVLLDDMDRAVAWRLAATVLLVVAGGLLAGLAPLALKGLIDAATGAPGWRDRPASTPALAFGAAYLLSLCGGRLLMELRPSLVGAAEQRLYARLRQRYFGHLLALPLAFHLGTSTGALVHGLQQAVSGYQVIVFHLVNSIVPVLVELATVTLVLASLGQPALMATFAGTALAYLGVMGLGQSALREGAHAVSHASTDAHGMLADGLLNVETIKCFGAEGPARDRFGRATDVLEERWARLQSHRLRMGFAVTATFALSMTASLAIAVHTVAQGALTTGGFVLANVYMLQVVRPLEMLGTATRDLSQALAFVRPLIAVLEELPETAATDSPANDADDMPACTVDTLATTATQREAPHISPRPAASCWTAWRSTPCPSPNCGPWSRPWHRTRCSSTRRLRSTSASARPEQRNARSSRRPDSPKCTSSLPPFPPATAPWSANAASSSPEENASASPSHGRC